MLRAAIITGIALAAVSVIAQDAAAPKPDAPNGSNATYSDDCLALAYRVSDGWKSAKLTQPSARHQSYRQMTQFRIERQVAAGHTESLELEVMDIPLEHPNMERFTMLLAVSLEHMDALKNKITRNPYSVTIADRSFFRSGLRSDENLVSLFTTWYRRHAVVAWAYADSPQELEDAVNALSVLSFGKDKRTTECFTESNKPQD